MVRKAETSERTLVIIKPDAVEKRLIGKVIGRMENNGLRIVAIKMVWMTKKEAQGFYDVHRDRSYFEGLTDFMASGPSVVMVLEGHGVIGKFRKMMGATDPANAKEGTIRRDWASDGRRNVVHGSDSPDSAATEISYFFSPQEICAGVKMET